ncbi:hypothetical protein BOTBODRAFT_55950 [Botryobasidium botryosum FD-172 SS1]|uniref:DUF6534 domain-containing protein n=1 Tax=Botryobasidium botryosum (strain FD-172 SS1) TaxID=930990 RepID=A0A067MQ42_BOTB1|nr:hypothetical protein BOTBODRAFT_55950 [Botryobasidium botryosum FD-172 SS1]
MSSAALAQAHPGLYLGPLVLGPLFQAIMQGLIIEKVGPSIAMSICASAFYDVWATFVVNFGNWVAATSFTWPQKLQTVYQATMTAPVQGYYIWRCWKVTKQNWWVTLPLVSLLCTSWACAVDVTRRVFQIDFPKLMAQMAQAGPPPPGAPPPAFHIPVDYVFVTWLTAAAVLDIAITSILLTYLLVSRSKSQFEGLNSVIGRLVFVLWETAIPPCACGLTVCITYLLMLKKTNNIDLFFQQIMGKLYVISLLVTLSARLTLNLQRTEPSYEMTPWSVRTKSQIRVEITTATKDDDHPLPRESGSLDPEFRAGGSSIEQKLDYNQPYDERGLHYTV